MARPLVEDVSTGLFEEAQVPAYGRLAYAQQTGCSADAALAGDDAEGVQMLGVHGCSLRVGGPTLITISYGTSLQDRKSTRLNSSHVAISYAVFCSKKTME